MTVAGIRFRGLYRHRCRADQRCQVPGAQEGSTVAGLEDVPAQSCRWYRSDGLVRGADHRVQAPLRAADYGPRPTTNPLARRYRTPNGGMDCQPADSGLWLGATPSLSDPRSGCLLRRHIRPTRSLAWHSRSSDLCTFTLAERICGTLIGSVRREWLDHILVVGEQHLRHILMCYVAYYNSVRTHLSLGKDAPVRRVIQHAGCIQMRPVLGGLHHHYVRI